jgi:maltose alpha-D-glucosyltransferase/alpha-amylase
MKTLIRLRRQYPEWAWGSVSVLVSDEPGVFAHRTDWQGRTLVAYHNLTDKNCSVRLSLQPDQAYRPIWGSEHTGANNSSALLELEPYGYGWYQLVPH